jgi:hypothetical protein
MNDSKQATRPLSRMRTLLEAAAVCFDEHRSPFTDDWLAEHKVTLDECMTLSEQIGLAIKNWARMEKAEERAFALMRASIEDPEKMKVIGDWYDYHRWMRKAAEMPAPKGAQKP